MRHWIKPWMLLALIVVWALVVEIIIYVCGLGPSLLNLFLK